ncbi:MAG: hypothetical protein ACR2HA_10415, partial [Nocardioides sp.]
MTVTLRPLGTGDIPALARHLAAVEAVDTTGEHYSEADLADEVHAEQHPGLPDRVAAYFQSYEFDAYFAATGRREAYVAKV